MMKNGCERGAGVFRVNIDLTTQNSCVREIAAEIEFPINIYVLRFQHLGNDFRQQIRFSEVFRANCYVAAVR